MTIVVSGLVALCAGCGPEMVGEPSSEVAHVAQELKVAWTTVQLPEAAQIHTQHPYSNNFGQKWTITAIPEATRVRVNFRSFKTERDCDFAHVWDGSGHRVASYSGLLGNFHSVEVLGNVVTVELLTDYSLTRYGFDVTSYDQVVPKSCSSDADCGREVCRLGICK